jgi:hypothetical protein
MKEHRGQIKQESESTEASLFVTWKQEKQSDMKARQWAWVESGQGLTR